ncbi:MAG: zinc ribbon domain-containing protein [Acidobacteriota bacterium]|nr:zinc ribbon domain-containing protein [Acidobacteriota bacterium]
MGIKRCPYCRALISDEDEFCKNCGTRLLFPEDEEMEEEIPGDKIIEDSRHQAEEDEKAGGKSKSGEVSRGEGSIQTETGDEFEESLAGGDEQEVILIDEEKASSQKKTAATGSLRSKKAQNKKTAADLLFSPTEESLPFPEGKEEKREETIVAGGKEENSGWTEKLENLKEEIFRTEGKGGNLSAASKQKAGPGLVTRMVDELQGETDERESSPEEKPGPGLVTQMISELQGEAGGEEPVQPEKQEPGPVTRMVNEIKKETATNKPVQTEETGPGLVTQLVQEIETERKRENKKAEEQKLKSSFSTNELEALGPTVEMGRRQIEDFFKVLDKKKKEGLDVDQTSSDESDNIPPWISDIKENSGELARSGQDESQQQEEVEEESLSRPTIGFPERVTRNRIELEKEESRELEMEIEEQGGEEETDFLYRSQTAPGLLEEDESQSVRASKLQTVVPLRAGDFIKAKVFDFLFVVLLWLLTVWLAARSMQVTVFKLLDVAATSLLIFLLILASIYFFLFYFFIGETLGDRLFRENEEGY